MYVKVKHDQHKSYKLLKNFSTLDRVWKSITLNFIVKLSKFKRKITETIYNFILIIVNQLIKYNYFLLYKKTSTAKDLIYTFLKTIVVNDKLLDEIISNKDKLFILKF